MRRRSSLSGLALLAGLLCATATAAPQRPPLRATAFGNVEIALTKVSGELWIERDVMEAKEPIDRDGDMQYSDGELLTARSAVTDYINNSFFILWEGKVHPIVVRDLKTEKRPGNKYDYLKVTWVAYDSPNGAPVSIVSRLLTEAWRDARTMLLVNYGKRKEVWVLSPTDYFDASLMGKRAENSASAGGGKPDRRFACLHLCLAVEMQEGSMKCPKCGSFIAELRGDGVPGAGYFGLHGGPLMPVGMKGRKLEAALASPGELRFYLTDDKLNKIPMDKMSGTVDLWTSEMMETTMVKGELRPAASGAYLSIPVPPNLNLPLRARCMLDIGEGGQFMVDFFVPEVVEAKD